MGTARSFGHTPNAVSVKKDVPAPSEMVRVKGRPGLYEVREVDQEHGTVHVRRDLPKRPLDEHVPLGFVKRLNLHLSRIIRRFRTRADRSSTSKTKVGVNTGSPSLSNPQSAQRPMLVRKKQS